MDNQSFAMGAMMAQGFLTKEQCIRLEVVKMLLEKKTGPINESFSDDVKKLTNLILGISSESDQPSGTPF